MLVCASLTTNRRLEVGPVASVAASVRPIRVPSCRGPGTSLRLHRTCGDTSRGVRSSGECAAASGAMGEGGYKLREAGNLSLELLDLWDPRYRWTKPPVGWQLRRFYLPYLPAWRGRWCRRRRAPSARWTGGVEGRVPSGTHCPR